MKLILELKENTALKNGDLLVYENGFFTKLSPSSLLHKTESKILDNKRDIDDLCVIISRLEQRVIAIEAELKYNRGEITEEEYKVCLGTR